MKIGEFLCRHIDGQAFHQGPWACPLNTDNGETEVDSDYPHHREFLEYGIKVHVWAIIDRRGKN